MFISRYLDHTADQFISQTQMFILIRNQHSEFRFISGVEFVHTPDVDDLLSRVVFANPIRLRILDMIAQRPYAAPQLQEQLAISKANLSQY